MSFQLYFLCKQMTRNVFIRVLIFGVSACARLLRQNPLPSGCKWHERVKEATGVL